MKEIVESFYDSFKRKDAEGMIIHYHPEIVFSDPAFGELRGTRVMNMWKMLCERGHDLQIQYRIIQIDESNSEVWVRWDAEYTFSKTGRKIYNSVESDLYFEGDKIVRHIDTFNIKNWAGQALGLRGKLLGNTRYFKKKLRQQFNQILDRYIEKKNTSGD